MTKKSKYLKLFSPLVALTALLCAPVAGSAQSILLSAGNFALLAGTTITSTGTVGTTIISGNVGVSPGTSITGFPPAVVTGGGAIIVGGTSAQAELDLGTAARGLAGMPSLAANNLSGTDLGGLTLPPGVYFFSGAASLNGALKLDAQGQNNAYWVFQIGTSLTTTVGSSVQVINPGTNGGADDGIFWVAETAAITLGADNVALGNYLAHTSITFGGTTSGEGRGLALAAVTLDTNVVNSQGGPSGSGWDGGLVYNLAGAVVPNVPIFTLQPVNQSVTTGANATFTAAASNGATYQWQRQPFGNLTYVNLPNGGAYSGTNTTTLTVSNATLAMSGDQFQVVAINGAGNTTSTSALLTVTTPLPVFSLQPVSENVTAGANTTFSVLANGNATYQWQREAFGNLTYVNLTNTGAYSNVTSAIMTVTNATLVMSGDQFRAVAMNVGGNTTSTSASLTVTTALPVFSLQPVSENVTAGANTTFSVLANGNATYQWQREAFGNLTYVNLTNTGAYSNVTSAIMTVTNATLVMSGDQFRAVATNVGGSTTSTTAVLTVQGSVTPLPVVTTQPSNQAVMVGANTTFTIATTGGLTYQWQVEAFGNLTYANLTEGGAFTGTNTTTLTVSNATLAMSGDQFRAVAMNDGGNTTSTSALLTVTTVLPVFSLQPVNQAVTTSANATFSVLASGNATYQWQRQAFGDLSYSNLTNTGAYSNVTGSVLTVTNATLAMSGDQFQAVATNVGGSTTSTSALLTVTTALPVFSLQPVNQSVNAGNNTTFSVLANGNATYQWQRLPFGNLTYANLTNTGAYSNVTGTVLSVTNATLAMSGDQFRAIATNLGGATTSTTALLAVIPVAPVITIQPINQATIIGGSTSFVAAANGAATYQWQVLTPGSLNYANLTNSLNFGGVTTGTLSITNAALGMSGDQFRAIATNTGGSTATDPATLTINSLKLMITVQPLPQTGKEATSIVFQIVAIGPGPLTYAWEKNNIKLKDGARVHQATTATLTLTNLYLVDAGNYRVVVSSGGKSLNSQNAKLTVTRITIPAIH